jgi:hypothetical protein
MASENPSSATARRNRMIAIVAGAITVTAIVVAFAAEYLDLPWKWLRPGVELLLLAELVGLVVLERHQLFEPVRENVGAMRTRVEEIHALISENTRSSGQVTACPSTTELFRTMARVLREALAREQGSPQILRGAWLAGRLRPPEEPDLIIEFREWLGAVSAFLTTPASPPHAHARRWSVRIIWAIATLENFDLHVERNMPMLFGENGKPSNFEAKILVRPRIEALLSPGLITDRDTVMSFDDANGFFHWGFWFQGPQYRALLERWFDDMWANIPDSYLIYSRNGFNQGAIDRIRKELAAIESGQADEQK